MRIRCTLKLFEIKLLLWIWCLLSIGSILQSILIVQNDEYLKFDEKPVVTVHVNEDTLHRIVGLQFQANDVGTSQTNIRGITTDIYSTKLRYWDA